MLPGARGHLSRSGETLIELSPFDAVFKVCDFQSRSRKFLGFLLKSAKKEREGDRVQPIRVERSRSTMSIPIKRKKRKSSMYREPAFIVIVFLLRVFSLYLIR